MVARAFLQEEWEVLLHHGEAAFLFAIFIDELVDLLNPLFPALFEILVACLCNSLRNVFLSKEVLQRSIDYLV
jgi:hypothetical protein